MNMVLMIAIALSMLSVVAVMGLGIYSMAKGGDFNKKYGNRIMQARVGLQGLALALLGLAYLASHS